MRFTILVYSSLVIITIWSICLIHVPEKTRRNNEVLPYALHACIWPRPITMYPCTWGHEMYNFSIPFLFSQTVYLVCFQCPIVEKIFQEITHFHYMIYMVMPYHKKICTEGQENFGWPFRDQFYYILLYTMFVWYMSRNREEREKNIKFYTFYPPKLQFLVSLFYRSNCGKNWPSSSREKDVNARRTTHDDWHQSITIGHINDWSDLKIKLMLYFSAKQ